MCMSSSKVALAIVILWLAAGCAGQQEGRASEELATSEEPLGRIIEGPGDAAVGWHLYGRHCQSCHGHDGQGQGPATRHLSMMPRDLTSGAFKFRSTPLGALPTDGDLYRTIARGLPGTAMPAFEHTLAPRETWHLVQYIKTLSPRFADPDERPDAQDVVFIAPRPEPDAASVARGRALYEQLGCPACHGAEGRGDGPAAAALTDAAGRPIRPANFRRGVFKGGGRPQDIYRSIATGLASTPMPAFGEMMEPGELWHLVHYVQSLEEERTFWDRLWDFQAGQHQP